MIDAPHFGVLDEQQVSVSPPEVVSLHERRDGEIAQRVKTGQEAFRLAQIFHPDVVATDERFLAAEKHALIALLPEKYAIPIPISEDEIATTPAPHIDDLYEHVALGMQTITDVATDNLALVRLIARKAAEKYGKTGGMTYTDYCHIGVEGALKAVTRYEPEKGRLSAHMSAQIDFAMRDAHRAATHARSSIPDDDVTMVSIDGPTYANADAKTVLDGIKSKDPEDNTEEAAVENETYRETLSPLQPREKLIFIAFVVEERQIKDIAREFGISTTRVAQIKASAVSKIRASNSFEGEQTA